jgi:surfeit locus 1 family protein
VAHARARLIRVAVPTAIAFAILVGLGTWQLQRLAWKEGVIAQMQARAAAAPVPLDQALARGGDLEFVRASVRGSFDPTHEFRVVQPYSGGLGWTVIAPFRIAGRPEPLLVVRGFVPDGLRDPAARPGKIPEGDIEVVGRLRTPETPGLFTPAGDAAKDVWYARDAGAMLASYGVANAAPAYMLELDGGPPEGGWPQPRPASPDTISNRHLGYALTWYGLAAALLGVAATFGLRIWRDPGRDGEPSVRA